nr:MAG TPA: hypothetical protein [Caudoviricetes sp.]
MKTVTITKTLYTYDELSPKAKARALEEFSASPSGAQADYEALFSDVDESISAFEDVTGVDIRIGSGVYATTYKADFFTNACYDDAFPEFSRDSVWCDTDIASAWINDDEFIDVRKEFAHCAYMRDRYTEESDIFFSMYTDADVEADEASTYLRLSGQADERATHYRGTMEKILSDAASRVCDAVDGLTEICWEDVTSEEHFSEECNIYEALFEESGRVYNGIW